MRRPIAEIQTRGGRSIEAGTPTTSPPNPFFHSPPRPRVLLLLKYDFNSAICRPLRNSKTKIFTFTSTQFVLFKITLFSKCCSNCPIVLISELCMWRWEMWTVDLSTLPTYSTRYYIKSFAKITHTCIELYLRILLRLLQAF